MKIKLLTQINKLILTVILSMLFWNNLFSEIIIVATKNADCKVENGAVTITITNGRSPYTYELIGPIAKTGIIADETITITNLANGDYQIIIRDSHGCIGMKEFSIGESTIDLTITSQMIPTPSGNPFFVLIANATDGLPPYIYSWPDGQYITDVTGTYSVTVADKNGCKKTKSINVLSFRVPRSRDPNDIIGPAGYGSSRFVSINNELMYTVHFENDPNLATASAKTVKITIKFDKSIDPYSFVLGSFGFGNYRYDAPENKLFYQTRLDLKDSLNIFLDISTGIDVTKNEAYWIFESIDPETGSKGTLDVNQGFLPVNDTAMHNGEGFITFGFKPKTTCITADSVRVMAKIQFDKNEPMNTGTAWNLIDALPPTSSVDSAYYDPINSRYNLSLSGKDDTLGSGLKDYDLYVSEENSPFTLYQSNVSGKFFPFLGKKNRYYSFCSQPRDYVNNTGKLSYIPETTIYLTDVPFLKFPDNSTAICSGMNLSIEWIPAENAQLDFEISLDNGNSFSLIASDIDASIGRLNWKIPVTFVQSPTEGLIRVINSNSRVVIDTSEKFMVKKGFSSDAGINPTACAGSKLVLGGSPTANGLATPLTYNWSPSKNLSSVTSENPSATIDSSITYFVSIIDSKGCTSFDSVKITVPPVPEVTLNGLSNTYCLNSEPAELTGTPAGGVLSGKGIDNNIFDPEKAGMGNHQIQYVYTNEFNCSSSISFKTTVDEALMVSFEGLNDQYYLQDTLITLIGNPLGGQFSGDGISGIIFNPIKAQIGLHTISYTFGNPQGCTVSVEKEVLIDKINNLHNANDLCVNKFNIFPSNPTSVITICLEPCRSIEGYLSIYDITGKRIEIIKKGLITNETTLYNVSGLKPGVYYVVVYSNNEVAYNRFTKN